jgi:hypothetical protein
MLVFTDSIFSGFKSIFGVVSHYLSMVNVETVTRYLANIAEILTTSCTTALSPVPSLPANYIFDLLTGSYRALTHYTTN